MFWFQLTRPQTTLLLFVGYNISNTLKQQLNGIKAYVETSTDENTVVNSHSNELPFKFAVTVKASAKTIFLRCIGHLSFLKDLIAKSSSCTTTRLSKLLTSCPTAVIFVSSIRYYETMYERSRKNMLWSMKNSGEVLS